MWTLPLALVDFGYVHSHGFDAASVGFTALTLLPAWAVLGRNVDLKFPGGGVKITGEDVEKAADKLAESAPQAVKRVEGELPRIQQEARERAALASAVEAKVRAASEGLALTAAQSVDVLNRTVNFPETAGCTG